MTEPSDTPRIDLLDEIAIRAAATAPHDWERLVLVCEWTSDDVSTVTFTYFDRDGGSRELMPPRGVGVLFFDLREQQVRGGVEPWRMARVNLQRTFRVDVAFGYPGR